MQQTNDQVVLVSEQDEVLGSMDKIEAHRGEGQLHRAVSVLLFRKKDGVLQLLTQQRSDQKIVGALQWANTICGNVWPGESYEDCAYRRLSFELGIEKELVVQTAPLRDVHTFRYQARCNDEFSENEMDHIFVGWFAETFEPNPDEVAATEWRNWEEVKNLPSGVDWAPWFVMMMRDTELVQVVSAQIGS